MTEPLYQTKVVAAATGATERMLQWWDERGHLPVRVIKHKRCYRMRDVLAARLFVCLIEKHVSLKQSVKILEELENGGANLRLVADLDNHVLLVNTSGLPGMQLVNPHGVLDTLLDSEEPVVAVDLGYEAAELAKALEGT